MTTRRRAALAAAGAALLGATLVPPAAAATPAGVALQVQYPDRSMRTWCVPYRAGTTGADVLAVATPTYGRGPYAGFVLKITGQGSTPTTTKYWAYWRSTAGTATGYAYSSTGVGSAKPAARSVEAWIWNTSSTTTPRKASYATLCPKGA